VTALTESFPRLNKGKDGLKTGLLIRGGTALTIYRGSLIAHRSGSELREVPDPANPRTDLIYDGVATNEVTITTAVDGNGAAVDADGNNLTLNTEAGLCCAFDTGTSTNAITANNIGQPCYGYDSNTLYLTDAGGTLSYVGLIYLFDEDSTVIVDIEAENPLGSFMFNLGQGGAPAGVTADDSARAVATNLAAGSFSGGVWTATANGALATQDGVTLAVGDKIVLPLGTLTTLVVGAADSGPYVVTSLGGASSKVVLTRTAKFAHGAIITPRTRVVVGPEGTNYKNTVWVAKPATYAKVVGTDDPLMFPEEMIIPLTCASGTATTTLCPLRAAGLFFIGIDWTGGSPAATTTSIQASTQTPGGIGTASIVIQEQSHLGTLVATGTATATVIVRQ
jgi:hypothetical protein